jgi:hypothetical protein
VTCVATFADGTFVSGSADKTIRLWDKATGETLRTFTCHTAGINCLATYPDGTFLSGSSDKTLRLWNKTTGETIQSYVGHTSSVYCVATFDDGTFVSGASNERYVPAGSGYRRVPCPGPLRLWNKASGEVLTTYAQEGQVRNILAFPEDKTFITVDENDVGNSQVSAWRTNLETPTGFYQGHDAEWEVNCIARLPPRKDKNRFITAACDATLRIWTVGTPHPNRTIDVPRTDCFNAIATLPSGEVIVATKKADDLFLYSTEPAFRRVPAGSSNLITGDDIVDGNEMVNLVRQREPKYLTNYNAGVFFKDSAQIRALTTHPISREPLDPQNFHPYIARVESNAVAKPVTTTRRRRQRRKRTRRM